MRGTRQKRHLQGQLQNSSRLILPDDGARTQRERNRGAKEGLGLKVGGVDPVFYPSPTIGVIIVGPAYLVGDAVIEKVMDKYNPDLIAQAIANAPQFKDGIKKGLANKPRPGVMGPSYAQNVRPAVIDALSSVSLFCWL